MLSADFRGCLGGAREFACARYLLFALNSLIALRVYGFVQNFDSAGNPAHWEVHSSNAPSNSFNHATGSIRYFLAEDGFSGLTAELNSIRAAFGQWESIPETAVRFEEGGIVSPGADINTSDGTNVIFWAKSSAFVNGGRDNMAGTLALTYRRVTNNNEIVEADIVLNGFQENWFSDFNDTLNAGRFIESSVLHEIGHWLGFEHSPVGGATMFARSLNGVGAQAGLSEDDTAAARTVYSFGVELNGRISGVVSLQSKPVFGAEVFLENASGNIEQGTLTRNDGFFNFATPEGNYMVRILPLDPGSPNSLTHLLTGSDIAQVYSGAQTSFLPTALSATVQDFQTNYLEIQVGSGISDFRITRLATPATDPAAFRAINAPIQVRPGSRDIYVGVCSTSAPPQNAILSITGDDIVVGPTTSRLAAFSSGGTTLNLLYAPISIASNATPGLRSLIVSSGAKSSFAAGCFEILPMIPDFNFDGLDDRFQRSHFEVFTSMEANAGADPDQDNSTNALEFLSGTDPHDAESVLKIETIAVIGKALQIRWRSVAGRVYRVVRADSVNAGIWTPIQPELTADGPISALFETDQSDGNRFYRIELVR
jgi:hypothetical protein